MTVAVWADSSLPHGEGTGEIQDFVQLALEAQEIEALSENRNLSKNYHMGSRSSFQSFRQHLSYLLMILAT